MALLLAAAPAGAVSAGPGATIPGLRPGATVTLPADMTGPVAIIGQRFDPPVTILAGKAKIRGLRIWESSGIIWRGGTITAETGMTGKSYPSYGVHIRGSSRVRLDDVTLTDAVRGVVTADSRAITIQNSRFTGLRSDGADIAGTSDVLLQNNVFKDFSPIKPTGDKAAGNWKDGDHPDAIQMWTSKVTPNPTDITIRDNIIEGDTQGINTFGPRGAGYDRIRVTGNRLRVGYPAAISLIACRDCEISGNDITTEPGARYKPNIRTDASDGRFCGNRLASVPGHPAASVCSRR